MQARHAFIHLLITKEVNVFIGAYVFVGGITQKLIKEIKVWSRH